MDAYNTNQLSNLQAQIQQIQQLMNQPRQAPAQPQPQHITSTIPFVDGLDGARQYLKTLGPNSVTPFFHCDMALDDTLQSAYSFSNGTPCTVASDLMRATIWTPCTKLPP